MVISDVSEEEYARFLEHGGTLTFEIDATDIASSRDFETSPHIQPFLESGFELTPSPIVNDPQERSMLLLYGGSWTRLVTHTYSNGGAIIYKKLPSGRYEAKAAIPEH